MNGDHVALLDFAALSLQPALPDKFNSDEQHSKKQGPQIGMSSRGETQDDPLARVISEEIKKHQKNIEGTDESAISSAILPPNVLQGMNSSPSSQGQNNIEIVGL